MCGRTCRPVEPRRATVEQPYEGETVRLDPSAITAAAARREGPGFPCWIWWMIWPLFWLAKGLFTLLAGVLAAMSGLAADLPVPHFWPVVLITVGVLLLHRRQR
jgi:hypothetical protein